MRAGSVHIVVRHASVEVNVVLVFTLLCLVTCLLLYASFQFSFVCDAVVHRTLVLIAFLVAIFHVAIFHVGFAVLEVQCSHSPSVTVDCRQL